MKTGTRLKIIHYIAEHKQARVHDLVNYLNLSNVAVHKQLHQLVASNVVKKVGSAPVVFYILHSPPLIPSTPIQLPEKLVHTINENFLSITPDGKLLYGIDGFIYWAELYQRNSSLQKLAKDYVHTLTEEQTYRTSGGWIDATQKLAEGLHPVFVDSLFFVDRHSYPLFGRTKMAKLVMHAKQSENKSLTNEIASLAKPVIKKLLKSIIFMPWDLSHRRFPDPSNSWSN